ncbi:hypothetical protein BDF19DRAFT_431553 [Syncephalis fuscata]|nr:hypothetical protein BDF19DRAFT_431553 [Syncephalis fuscata]
MIIAFLVDTSSYTDQRFADGVRLLSAVQDAAIRVVEQLQSTTASVRYMLVTYGRESTAVKCDLSSLPDEVLYALQRLDSSDKWNPGESLRTLFNTLSIDRTIRDVDTFGRGRVPGVNESVKIIWCAYGGRVAQGDQKLEIPGSTYPGTELYREPFRWDERIHLMLMLPQGETPAVEQLSMMSNLTGGEVTWPTSSEAVSEFMQWVISPQLVVQGIPRSDNGVLVHFEDIKQDPNHTGPNAILSAFISLHVHQLAPLYFPIPEAYWPTSDMSQLPVRGAHPILRIIWHPGTWTSTLLPQEHYDVFSKPLLAHMQAYPQDGHWKVYVTDSGATPGLGDPFGVLQRSSLDTESTEATIRLTLLPYNYPMLSTILESESGGASSMIANYMMRIPCYYKKYIANLLKQRNFPTDGLIGNTNELPLKLSQQLSRMMEAVKTVITAKKRLPINPFEVTVNDLNARLAELQVSLLKGVPNFSTVQLKWPVYGSNLNPCIMYGDDLAPIESPVLPPVPMGIDMDICIDTTAKDLAMKVKEIVEPDPSIILSPKLSTKDNNEAELDHSTIPAKRLNTDVTDQPLDTTTTKIARTQPSTNQDALPVEATSTKLSKTKEHQKTITTTTIKSNVNDINNTKAIKKQPSKAIRDSSTATTTTAKASSKPSTATATTATPSRPLEAPNDMKTRLVKHIKQGRKLYNEEEIVEEMNRLVKSNGYTRDQKRTVLAGCLLAARTMKRKTLIETLDHLKIQLD